VELPSSAQGMPTPEALSIVLHHAERLLSGHAVAALSVITIFRILKILGLFFGDFVLFLLLHYICMFVYLFLGFVLDYIHYS
jgi:hypothetical protein